MKQLNEVARMQQLAGINEIKVNNPSPSPKDVLDNLKILTQSFGEGSSPEEGQPSSEEYRLDYYDTSEEEYIPIQSLLQKYPDKTFFIPDFFGFRDPNTPQNGYETIVKINDDFIEVSTNYVNDDGEGEGWYTRDGEFHI